MKIRLIDIAHARSGDKGDTGNVGLIARKPEFFPIIQKYVTVERVKNHFEGVCFGKVERFELPNICALNFLLHNALGGGGTGVADTSADSILSPPKFRAVTTK